MAIFARVVEDGGFTAASRGLGLSKAAVSKAVARLEQHLGERLLQRSTRRVTPTELGRTFHGYCQAIVHQADLAEQHLGQLREEPTGMLRMTAPLSFGIARVAPLLPALQSRHPSLQVALILADEVIDLVAERVDLALRAGPLKDSGLIARQVGEVRASIVASPAYLQRHGAPKTPQDLAHHACLRYDEHVRHWSLGHERSVPIGRGLAINNTVGQLNAARAGGGLALLADYLTEGDVASGGLVPVLTEFEAVLVPVFAVHPYSRHVPAKVRAAVDYFSEVFALPHP
jgi:DNA-binding transcriptional LysR family regulator